jgi:xylan 1,4-beta-xylosidase
MRIAATSLAVLALAAGGCGDDGPQPRIGPTVTVDLSTAEPTRGSMNGFLHSLSAAEPADALVAPLRPHLWRGDGVRAPVARATALGAQYELAISDLWGYPPNRWGGRGAPWRNLRRWGAFVRAVARAYRGQPVIWDVWNEPDGPTFFTGGRKRFLRVYAVAARALTEELGPGVVVGGPSVSRFSRGSLAAFLDGCLALRGCRVSFLAWHANLRPGQPIARVADDLRLARRIFVENPRYAPLGLRAIHVNEYVGQVDRYRPGEAVAYLSALTEGGADLAARSCWSLADCGARGLDGLLDPASGRRRAAWWVHRWYAAAADGRVRTRVSDTTVAGLAARRPGTVQLVLGRTGPGTRRPRLILRGLPPRQTQHVRVELVPASGAAPVDRPSVRSLGEEHPGDDGRLRLTLPALGAHEAMRVLVSAAG